MIEREKGPKSDFTRYAFGYSDKKPGWSFWFVTAIMVVTILVGVL